MDVNMLWREFYLAEQELYKFLKTQEMLHCIEGCAPEYHSKVEKSILGPDRIVEVAPAYVRCTIALRNGAAIKKHHSLYEDTLEAFETARIAAAENGGYVTTRLPDRFPQFLTNIEQINLSVNEAVQSLPLEPGGNFLALKQLVDPEDRQTSFAEEIKALKEMGIKTEVDGWGRTRYLYIDCDSLFEYAGTDKIQHRKYTGSRYLARVRSSVREPGKPKTKRLKYGLLILDKPCPIYQSLPRSDRDDQLALIGEEIKLPIGIDGKLWDRVED